MPYHTCRAYSLERAQQAAALDSLVVQIFWGFKSLSVEIFECWNILRAELPLFYLLRSIKTWSMASTNFFPLGFTKSGYKRVWKLARVRPQEPLQPLQNIKYRYTWYPNAIRSIKTWSLRSTNFCSLDFDKSGQQLVRKFARVRLQEPLRPLQNNFKERYRGALHIQTLFGR